MSQSYLGEIKLVGWNFASRGFSLANGAILSIAQNTALFSLLGTTYGGNGQTTFQLPNLGGRTPIGQGQSPGTSNYSMGQLAGVENTTLLITNMPQHNHIAATTVVPTTTINALGAPTGRSPTPAGNLLTSGFDPNTSAIMQNFCTPGAGTALTLAPEATTSTASATTSIQPAGGSQPFSILQPYLTLNYIIALEGIFPSRN